MATKSEDKYKHLPSASYWIGRTEKRVTDAERQMQRYQDVLDAQFKAAASNLDAQIAALYRKYADANSMEYGDAVKYLTDHDREEFQRDVNFYIKNMKDQAYRSQNLPYLHALSTRARVQRLEAMKASIRMEAGNLYSRMGGELQQALQGVFDETRARTAFDTFQGTGVGLEFGRANPRVFEALLKNPWSGSDFSEKLWNLEGNFVRALETTLTRGLIQGQSIDEMVRELQQAAVGKTGASTGQRYQAERLVRTEANYIINQATASAYEEMQVDRYQYLATLDNITSEICQTLDGQVFPTKDATPGVNYPPTHPNCRSTTIPYFEDLGGERIARDEEGKSYNVPADMTYKRWYTEHGPGAQGDEGTNVSPSVEETPTKPESEGAEQVKHVGNLDPAPIEVAFGSLQTNEVVLTDERRAHIQERHPEDYAFFEKYGADAVGNPDIILSDDKHTATIFVIKQLPDTNLNVIIRLALAPEKTGLKNSVMTFYRIRDKNLVKLILRNQVLYRRE